MEGGMQVGQGQTICPEAMQDHPARHPQRPADQELCTGLHG
ncbi:MAG: hypothetical protein ACRD0N_12740 [Acidimicrobiales bacterium]